MKKLFSLLICAALALSLLSGCGAPSAEKKDYPTAEHPVTFQLSLPTPLQEYSGLVVTKFKEEVEARTGGAVLIEIYPQGQLGSEKVVFDGVSSGTVDMSVTSSNVIATAIPEFNAMVLPFNFDSLDLFWDVVGEDEFKEKFNELCEPKGFHYLGVVNSLERCIHTLTPVKTPEDLKGMKIRVMDGEIYTDMFTAWNAGTSVIPFGELYTALQQKVVDGHENDTCVGVTMKFSEVAKYIVRTNHVIHNTPLIINNGSWAKLSPEQQALVEEAVAATQAYAEEIHPQVWEETEAQARDEFGVTIYDPTEEELQQWKDAVMPLYDKYKSVIGEDFYSWFMEFVDAHRTQS